MKTIAITSGKGGVGKTSIAANLALILSSKKLNTVVFDADFGLANLDIMLGTKAEYSLTNMITDGMDLLDILCKGPDGIRFVAGGSGVQELINLSSDQIDSFFEKFGVLASITDCLIIDTAAGLSESVIRFVEAADEVILIVTPDPASIMDAYATTKTIFLRNPNASIRTLVNSVENESQAIDVYQKLNTIVKQFLKKTLWYAGYVRRDPSVVECARKRQPFVISAPKCPAAQDLRVIANNLLKPSYEVPKTQPLNLFQKLKASFSKENFTQRDIA